MLDGFSWTAFVSHIVVAILGYFGGLFTPPPGSDRK